MTDGNDDGNYLVRVRAQVMTRDDNSGGWVPLGSGGLSTVSVRKRTITSSSEHEEAKHEYYIYGKRLLDQSVVLSCVIKKDFEYNKVMPAFHHWKTGDKKFGLTFQTAADAREFDKGVRMAVEDLRDGLEEFSSYRYGYNSDAGDDDVFITVDLPVERDGSRSSSGSTTTNSSSRQTPTTTPLPTPDHPTQPIHHRHHHHHLHHNTSPCSTISSTNSGGITTQSGCTYPNHHHNKVTFVPTRPVPAPPIEKPTLVQETYGENYSYVQFAKEKPWTTKNEYSYPIVEGQKSERRDSIASLKKAQQMELIGRSQQSGLGSNTPPALPQKRPHKRDRRRRNNKLRCKHCHDMYHEDINGRGSCPYAPDYVRTAIDCLTCVSCAQCMLYQCMSDTEGEFIRHPCECISSGAPVIGTGRSHEEATGCGKKWVGFTLLSVLLPCLWCYLPLRACHRCAVSCGMCGGKHEASSS